MRVPSLLQQPWQQPAPTTPGPEICASQTSDASSQNQLPSALLSTRSRRWPDAAPGRESNRALPRGSRDRGRGRQPHK